MNSFLNQSQIAELTGMFSNHFSTFSSGINNFITITKTPIQSVLNTSAYTPAGFGIENTNISNTTYSSYITGYYPAMIIYPSDLKSNEFGPLKFELDENQVMIKIQSDAKDFILNGRLEKIEIDGFTYNAELTPKIQNFMGLKFFYFKLTSSK